MKVLQTKGVIKSISYPFSFFKKKNPIVSLRLYSGYIMKLEATHEMIEKLPISIAVGTYTEIEYQLNEKNTGYKVIRFS